MRGSARSLIAKKVRVQTESLDLEVLTDSKWLVFILRQLVENAVKYGGSTLRFSAEQTPDSAVLLLGDDGIGISEADLPRIFEKGFT